MVSVEHFQHFYDSRRKCLQTRARGRGRRARARLQRVDDGLEVDIDERAGTRRLRRQQNTAHAAAARAHRQLTLGSITRAVKCLAATPIAEPTDATVETLRCSTPHCPTTSSPSVHNGSSDGDA